MKSDLPFFMIGTPRCGTTILRDILRTHPRLAAPEETHFYRWPFAFKSPGYCLSCLNNGVLKKHRKIDKINEDEFHEIFKKAEGRKSLQEAYMNMFLARQSENKCRWFDKTPQNVYGLLLLMDDYPKSKFIHIHRNPIHVITSLQTGTVMHRQDLIASINWWLESETIISKIKQYTINSQQKTPQIFSLSYAKFTSSPKETLDELFDFLDEDPTQISFDLKKIYPEKNKYRDVLNLPVDLRLILRRCGKLMQELNYNTDEKSYL